MTTLTRTAYSGTGRHVARRGIRSLFSVRSMMATGAAVLIAVCLAIVATGGTYALWNKSQPTSSNAVITSGKAELTVTTPLVMPNAVMYPGMPNPILYGSAVVTNSGNVPLALRTSGFTVPVSTSFSQSLKVGIATASTAANCAAGTVSTAWVYSTAASPTVASIGTTVTVGQSSVVCVSVQFSGTPDNTVQGQGALNFTAAIDGIQN